MESRTPISWQRLPKAKLVSIALDQRAPELPSTGDSALLNLERLLSAKELAPVATSVN
jgi:hypothetical protein